jgi:hypothetical protein
VNTKFAGTIILRIIIHILSAHITLILTLSNDLKRDKKEDATISPGGEGDGRKIASSYNLDLIIAASQNLMGFDLISPDLIILLEHLRKNQYQI